MKDDEEKEYYFVVEVEGEEAGSSPLIITRELKHCDILEVEDFHFNYNSAVLLPVQNALDRIACCYLYTAEKPSKLILIAGHTDKSGDPQYNQWLSKKRAENVLNVLLGRREDWVCSVTSEKGPTQKFPDGKSKTEDYQMILKWIASQYGWPCDPGKGKDIKDGRPCDPDDARKAIEAFQRNWNDNSALRTHVGAKPITVDGRMGPETWGGFFDVYMLELAKLLGLDSDVARLENYRKTCKFIGDRKTASCSESHACDSQERSLQDRRVHILFFDPDEKPKLAFHPNCHEGPPDDPESYMQTGKKAKECELYGEKSIYEKIPMVCDPYRILFIEVLDQEGKHKAGVNVIVEREGAGVYTKGATNTSGVLLIRDVPKGAYVVSVDTGGIESLDGFKGVIKRVEFE